MNGERKEPINVLPHICMIHMEGKKKPFSSLARNYERKFKVHSFEC